MELLEYDFEDLYDMATDLANRSKTRPIYVRNVSGSADFTNVVVSYGPITQKEAVQFCKEELERR